MKRVVLVWGGWSCTLGYIHWAYVAEALEDQTVNTAIPGSEKIGGRIHSPANRKEVSDTKNCDYGKEPNPWPRPLCTQWIKDNNCELVATVKMRTD